MAVFQEFKAQTHQTMNFLDVYIVLVFSNCDGRVLTVNGLLEWWNTGMVIWDFVKFNISFYI